MPSLVPLLFVVAVGALVLIAPAGRVLAARPLPD
jgi:hypothetical protein